MPPHQTTLILFAIALIARAVLAWPQTQPGYMDASYYYNIALNLAQGRGFTEQFIWNYLAHPTSLPQPSNAHWMPLISILIAPFLWAFGDSYRAAQIVPLFLSALLAPLTYRLSLQFFQQPLWAWLSAALMLASSFYTPFWAAIDNFALYALLGTGVLLLSSKFTPLPKVLGQVVRSPNPQSPISPSDPQFRTPDPRSPIFSPLVSRAGASLPSSVSNAQAPLICGILIGLAHLTRADGFLLAAPLLLLAGLNKHWRALCIAALGYGFVMLPWFGRNWLAFGTPLVGSGALFMREYNDLFVYEKSLTLTDWLAGGAATIVTNQLRALRDNLLTLMGALHFVFAPCALLALWHVRRHPLAQAVWIYLLTLLAVMSFVFSLPGPRGTFLHSLTAALPLLYVFAPVGLALSVQWIAQRRRTWDARQAMLVFGGAFVVMALLLSLAFYVRQLADGETQVGWNKRHSVYRAVAVWLQKEAPGEQAPVMCINPPAYWYFNRHAALAIPTDGIEALLKAAAQFGVRYLLLEADHPQYLAPFYQSAVVTEARLRWRATIPETDGRWVQIYEIANAR